MPKITRKVVLSEAELKDILCQHFKLDNSDANITVYRYKASDPRETSYTEVTVEGTELM